jgi:hypothetical protein
MIIGHMYYVLFTFGSPHLASAWERHCGGLSTDGGWVDGDD